MNKNYIKLKNIFLFSKLYVFLDTADHLYEQVLRNNDIMVSNIKEFYKENSPFRLISCKVKKKDEQDFCREILQIRNKALILGYRDYDNMCRQINECEKILNGIVV